MLLGVVELLQEVKILYEVEGRCVETGEALVDVIVAV